MALSGPVPLLRSSVKARFVLQTPSQTPASIFEFKNAATHGHPHLYCKAPEPGFGSRGSRKTGSATRRQARQRRWLSTQGLLPTSYRGDLDATWGLNSMTLKCGILVTRGTVITLKEKQELRYKHKK